MVNGFDVVFPDLEGVGVSICCSKQTQLKVNRDANPYRGCGAQDTPKTFYRFMNLLLIFARDAVIVISDSNSTKASYGLRHLRLAKRFHWLGVHLCGID